MARFVFFFFIFIFPLGLFAEEDNNTNTNEAVFNQLLQDVDKSSKKSRRYDKKLSNVNIFKDIFISVDSDLHIYVEEIFLSQKYSELNLRNVPTEGSLDAINYLKKSKANIAIVRGDVLGIKNNGLLGLEKYNNYGIVCSPSTSILYLVSKKDIKSIDDMKGMRVSTGLTSNIAQLYLADIARSTGIPLDISYMSLNLEDSLSALKDDNIDAIFIFASEDFTDTFLEHKFKIHSLPNVFFNKLKVQKGLNPHSIYIKKKRIQTVEVQDFLIAPKNTLDSNMALKIEAMVSAFECYNTIQNIDPFYGDLHESLKPAIKKIHKRINLEEAISFTLKSKSKSEGTMKYIYEVSNHSDQDMNITLKELRTNSFDKIPIRPRHLITVVPSGDIALKKNAKKIVTYIYNNPFIYTVKKRNITVVYQNLTVKESEDVKFSLSIGDK
jgi:TRAP-type uncharacterized transport system substrate-binding protein